MASVRTKDPLGTGLKIQESHKQPIYCLDWSMDLYEEDEEEELYRKEQPEIRLHETTTTSSANGKMPGSRTKPLDVAADDNMSRENRYAKPGFRTSTYRVLASCSGRFVNVYQLKTPQQQQPTGMPAAKGSRGSSGSSSNNNEPLTLIQSYIDADNKEDYYTCVFAGRCMALDQEPSPQSQRGQQQQDHPRAPAFAQQVDRDSRRPTKLRRGNSQEATVLHSSRTKTSHSKAETASEPCASSSASRLWPLSGATGTGPQYLCVAGTKGTIKLIDVLRQRLAATLVGHGFEIYDLKRCPTDEFLLASASKDNTARLWNLKTGAQVAVVSGHEGHLDDIVSLAWHPSGNVLATGSMDTTVKLWYVGPGTGVRRAIKRSHAAAHEFWTNAVQHTTETRTVEVQVPIFTTYQLHFYCVDCVHFLGDWMLSRSQEDSVVLWEPQYPPPNIATKTELATNPRGPMNPMVEEDKDEIMIVEEKDDEIDTTCDPFTSCSMTPAMIRRRKELPYPVPNQLKHLRTYKIPQSQYWFIRFGVDHQGRTLVTGNASGEIYIFKIASKSRLPIRVMDGKPRKYATVRCISFSPDDDVMVAATDLGEIWKWPVRREKQPVTTGATASASRTTNSNKVPASSIQVQSS